MKPLLINFSIWIGFGGLRVASSHLDNRRAYFYVYCLCQPSYTFRVCERFHRNFKLFYFDLEILVRIQYLRVLPVLCENLCSYTLNSYGRQEWPEEVSCNLSVILKSYFLIIFILYVFRYRSLRVTIISEENASDTVALKLHQLFFYFFTAFSSWVDHKRTLSSCLQWTIPVLHLCLWNNGSMRV